MKTPFTASLPFLALYLLIAAAAMFQIDRTPRHPASKQVHASVRFNWGEGLEADLGKDAATER